MNLSNFGPSMWRAASTNLLDAGSPLNLVSTVPPGLASVASYLVPKSSMILFMKSSLSAPVYSSMIVLKAIPVSLLFEVQSIVWSTSSLTLNST